MSLVNSYPLLAHCPICQAAYIKENMQVIEEKAQARLYFSACEQCGHGLLAYVVEVQGGISSLGLITDASAVDLVRLSQAGEVGAEECLAFHRLLADKSQELCRGLLDIAVSSGSASGKNQGIDMSGKLA